MVKRPGDSKLPQRKEDLLRRYRLTCSRSEQERNRFKEGEQPAIEDAAAHQGVVSAVPEVAAGDELDAAEALIQM